MIIETSCNRFYRVEETNMLGLEHVWYGVKVKHAKGEWIDRAGARRELVRKAASRVVEA